MGLHHQTSLGCIIKPLWAAHSANVEEAWDEAAETNAVPPSEEFPLSPQRYSPGSTHASIRPVPTMVNPFGAQPFQALRDVVRDAFPLPTVALERPQHPQQSNLKPEKSREHALVPPGTKSLEYVTACPQPEPRWRPRLFLLSRRSR